MISRERVQAVIERIRPLIQGDGGDIELVDVVDNKAKVRLTGNCVGCPSAQMTLFMGVEMAIKEEIPEFEELLVVILGIVGEQNVGKYLVVRFGQLVEVHGHSLGV